MPDLEPFNAAGGTETEPPLILSADNYEQGPKYPGFSLDQHQNA